VGRLRLERVLVVERLRLGCVLVVVLLGQKMLWRLWQV